MASYSNTDMLFMESEKIYPKLQEWVNRFDTPANLIPKRDVQMYRSAISAFLPSPTIRGVKVPTTPTSAKSAAVRT